MQAQNGKDAYLELYVIVFKLSSERVNKSEKNQEAQSNTIVSKKPVLPILPSLLCKAASLAYALTIWPRESDLLAAC